MSTLSKLSHMRNWKEHWIITSVLLWSALIIVISIWYVVFGISRGFSITLALAALGAWYALVHDKLPEIQLAPTNIFTKILFAIVIITNIGLGYALWHGRTDIALRSPWEVVSGWFFIGFAATLLLHVYATVRERSLSALSFTALLSHYGLVYGAAVFAFRFGYAYDPIIHQAAENYVVAHGKIAPIQPFYIGQYSLVAAAHFISTAPVWLIDRLLLPILAIVSIPVIGYIGFTRGWRLPHRATYISLLALTCLPLAELTFTVPHNLTVLYSLWWVLLLPLALQTRGGSLMLSMIAVATCLTHPLLGVPLALATAAALLTVRYKKIYIPIIATFLIGGSLLAMLGMYRIQQNLPFLVTHNPFDYISNFISIFEFSYSVQHVRPALQLAYGLIYIIPFGIVVIGAWCAFRYRQVSPAVRSTLLSLIGGIIIAIFLVSTMIYIPGIADHEQNEFMLRLRYIFPIFMLPLAVTVLYTWLHVQRTVFKVVTLGCMIITATISFYFTYPRVNSVTRPGWNISRSDIETVQGIAQLSHNQPYVVLGNQILAVAGLRELGFDHRLVGDDFNMYPYPISMAEPLHPITQEILYQQLNAPALRAIAYMINGSVFVAVHDYWYRASDIFTEARDSNPDAIYTFGQITVFEFKK